jgi:mono/diheme cytochrome c family protein
MNLSSVLDQHRRVMRRHARHLLRDSSSTEAHLARISAALELPGAEPVQGVLADVFTALGADQAAFKRNALATVKARLSPHIASWFESQVQARRLPRISPLATRWSVLSIPSADISTRARRCSADDSRALAAHAVLAVEAADAQGEQLFLHHCLTCHDNLAFMLARRQLLKSDCQLPVGWDAVSRQLEQRAELA